MVEYARKHKVTITLETEPDYNDYLLGLIEGMDSQACGICLDVGHTQIESEYVTLFMKRTT